MLRGKVGVVLEQQHDQLHMLLISVFAKGQPVFFSWVYNVWYSGAWLGFLINWL
jgi:hypothetical protein